MTPPPTGTQRIELPFPPANLSPNARIHWRTLHRAKLAYQTECAWTMIEQGLPRAPATDRIPLTITFHPPDNRRRDRDNMQASLKYGLDQLARTMGVDDYRFDPSYRFAEPSKPGKVVIEL